MPDNGQPPPDPAVADPRAVELRGDLRSGDLRRLAERLERRPIGGPIDLKEIRPVDPAALALLVASLEGGRESEEWHADEQRRLLGWKAFASVRGVEAAACTIAMTITEMTSWTSESCTTFTALALEVLENVGHHSGRADGVLALSVDPSNELINLAVADRGIGIRGSLLQNAEFAGVDDDLMAIEKAMEAGGTGEPGSGGGMGLYFARALLRGNGGRMAVHSGTASLEEADERAAQRHSIPLTGTLVVLEARGDRPLAADEVTHRLAALRPST